MMTSGVFAGYVRPAIVSPESDDHNPSKSTDTPPDLKHTATASMPENKSESVTLDKPVWGDEASAELILAIKNDNPDDVQRLLKHQQFDMNARNKKGNTLLMFASKCKSSGVVDLLLKRPDVDANATNDRGKTALMIAAGGGHAEVAKTLIDDGRVNLDAQDPEGKTALMLAILCHNKEAIRKLANSNADLNIQDNCGETALMYVIRSQSIKSTKQLLRNSRIKIDLKNNKGETAHDIAKKVCLKPEIPACLHPHTNIHSDWVIQL